MSISYLGEVGRTDTWTAGTGAVAIPVGMTVPVGSTVIVLDFRNYFPGDGNNPALNWTDTQSNSYVIDRRVSFDGSSKTQPEWGAILPISNAIPPGWCRISSSRLTAALHSGDEIQFTDGAPGGATVFYHGAIALAFSGLRASDYLAGTHGAERIEVMPDGGDAPTMVPISLHLPGFPVSQETGKGRLEIAAVGVSPFYATFADGDPAPDDLSLTDEGSSPAFSYLGPISLGPDTGITYPGEWFWVAWRITDSASIFTLPAHVSTAIDTFWQVDYKYGMAVYIADDATDPNGAAAIASAPHKVGSARGETLTLSEAVPINTRLVVIAVHYDYGSTNPAPSDAGSNSYQLDCARAEHGLDPGDVRISIWSSYLAVVLLSSSSLTVAGAACVFAYTISNAGITPGDATYLVPLSTYFVGAASEGVRDQLYYPSNQFSDWTQRINLEAADGANHGIHGAVINHGRHGGFPFNNLGLSVVAAKRLRSEYPDPRFAGVSWTALDTEERIDLGDGHDLDVYTRSHTLTPGTPPHTEAAPSASITRFSLGSEPLEGYEWCFLFAVYAPDVTALLAISGRSLLQDYLGRLHVADQVLGNIRYRRADRALPPYVLTTAVTALGIDTQPVMAVQGDLLHLLWQRGDGDVYWTTSDDDGGSFKEETLLITGGKHPAMRVGVRGDVLFAAFVDVGGGIGVVKGIYRDPAGNMSSIFTFEGSGGPYYVIDDVFSFDQAKESGERWLIFWQLSTDSEASIYWSGDEGATWQPV